MDLLASAGPLRLLAAQPVAPAAIATGPRVGVGGAGAATPWRFWLAGDPTVSAYRAHTAAVAPQEATRSADERGRTRRRAALWQDDAAVT